jgi:hypothetical protein
MSGFQGIAYTDDVGWLTLNPFYISADELELTQACRYHIFVVAMLAICSTALGQCLVLMRVVLLWDGSRVSRVEYGTNAPPKLTLNFI